jgi:SAM-dependent methyltransferase
MKRFIRWQFTKVARATGYDWTPWLRISQRRSWELQIRKLGPEKLSVLEVSPGLDGFWRSFTFGRYNSVEYPAFDICSMALEDKFDLIIADNVFEHVTRPEDAARNVARMLRQSGTFLIAAPFLFKFHPRPGDYWRWTKQGMKQLLVNAGFSETATEVFAWGNRACVRANLDQIVPYGWYRPLDNEEEFPVMVWGFGRL